MSKLAAALATPKPRNNGTPCFFARLIPTLDEIDRKALENAFTNPHMTGAYIAAILTEEGHPVRGHTVQWHRTGRCSCSLTS